MSTLLLFILTIASFLFYGVVGPDKTGLLAPVISLTYGLVAVSLLKRALAARQSGPGRTAVGPPAGALLTVFVLYGVALIPSATVPFEATSKMLFVGAVVGAYLVWGRDLTAFKDNRVLLGALLFVVMLTALYGLIAHFKCPDQVLWAERYAIYKGRLASTYICPNHFAHLLQMLLPFCLALLFIPQTGIYLKLLAAYSFLVFLPPLYLSESRAGWLGSIAAVGTTICLMALRRSKKLFLAVVVLVPLCSILLLFAGWRYSETFQRRMAPVVEFLEGQADEGIGSESRDFRPQTWMDTIDMIKEKPLIGFGPGNYRYTFEEHRNRFKGTRIVTGHPHNEYLEIMADYGIVGFVLFAVAWVYGLVRILRFSLKTEETRHAFLGLAFLGTAAGTMVHSFFDFEMHVFPNAMVFALLAALSTGPLFAARRTRGAKQQAPDAAAPATNGRWTAMVRRTGAWLLALSFALAALLCIRTMSSSFLRLLGDEASSVRNRDKAEEMYRLAVKVDPQNWRAYKGMAELVYSQRYHVLDLSEKVRLAADERHWYEKAYRHNAHDPEIIVGYGKSMVFLGRTADRGLHPAGSAAEPPREDGLDAPGAKLTDQGLALLREACGYRKFNDLYWWVLGVELRKAGRYDEALEVFRYAESLRRTASTRKNIQWIEGQLRNGGRMPESGDPTPVVQPDPSTMILKGEDIQLSELFELME